MLSSVFAEANRPEEARQYQNLARRYVQDSKAPQEELESLTFLPPANEIPLTTESAPAEPVLEIETSESLPAEEATELSLAPTFPNEFEASSEETGAVAHEIDLSEEWERVVSSADGEVSVSPSAGDKPADEGTAVALADSLDEIRFYLSQGMAKEARRAIGRAEAAAPGTPLLSELREKLQALESGNQANIELVFAPEDRPAAKSAGAPQASPVPDPKPAPKPGPAFATGPEPDVLHGFVQDLEESLGKDFAIGAGAPSGNGNRPAPPAEPAPMPAMADAAAAGTMAGEPENEPSEEMTELGGLFAEFKRDVESTSNDGDDDLETHYNLGVAFKEMSLYDEAIGELQKVCRAVEGGQPFPKSLEAYTWLAHCFVDKGLPEAAVHWYEKALQLPNLISEQVLAIRYELACAHQAAGDLPRRGLISCTS